MQQFSLSHTIYSALMDKRKNLTGFIVVRPGKIIEIPQDSDKSWLTLFYSCPYEVLRTGKYDHIVCDDMFKLLVWNCHVWSVCFFPGERPQG